MSARINLLAMIGASAIAAAASPASAQAYPGDPKVFTGTGIFTDDQVYMGPIVGYVDTPVNSPFSFSINYFNFMGSDTLLPGTVNISSPLFSGGGGSFTGQLAISTAPTNASISVSSTFQYLALELNLAAPFPSQPSPVAIQPTSTINYSGRFFGFSGVITSFSTSSDVAAVPETATWAMMMVGLGILGGALRRRRQRVTTRVAFA